MLDNGRGDEEADILQSRNPLKSNPGDALVLNHRPAAVTRVDSGVGLDAEETSNPDVGVSLHFNAGDNASSIGDFFATGWITDSNDGRTDFRQIAEFERLDVFK